MVCHNHTTAYFGLPGTGKILALLKNAIEDLENNKYDHTFFINVMENVDYYPEYAKANFGIDDNILSQFTAIQIVNRDDIEKIKKLIQEKVKKERVGIYITDPHFIKKLTLPHDDTIDKEAAVVEIVEDFSQIAPLVFCDNVYCPMGLGTGENKSDKEQLETAFKQHIEYVRPNRCYITSMEFGDEFPTLRKVF